MKHSTPRLSIHLLGTPEISMDGAPLVLNHLKARALLFYLAGTGERHGRDHLASLLWSEAGASEAHHSLRSTIYRLRQAVEGDAAGSLLVGEAETLFLDPAAFTCDALDFRRLLERGNGPSLRQAVALYRGPFLQGFSVSNAAVFEEWMRGQDAYFNQASIRALDRL